MIFFRACAAISLVTLAACKPSSEDQSQQSAVAGQPTATQPAEIPPQPSEGVDDDDPDLTPVALTPEAAKGEAGARSLLLSFARAIELKEFEKAYAMLGERPRRHLDKGEFKALLNELGTITVLIPEGRMEGAAGSMYYEVPATISGSGGKSLAGTIVLRRVNDVPGASEDELRWHIETFDVAPNG